jgi:D-apionolactonase
MPASKLSQAVMRYGTETVEAKARVLKAGKITAVFDAGAIRYIRYGEHEVLRGIAYLLRDKNWATYAAKISNLKVKQGRDGFSISYHADCADSEQALSYDAKIEATAKGVVKFSVTGLPKSDFLTNRTGFVVLHPLKGVVGAPVEVVHTDGKRRKTKFPGVISPGQPIFDIRSLKHTVTPGLSATVLMEGNKFEMEDHRNWMDASYKTYVCSLLDPWPYTLKKGEPFTQSVTVTLEGKPASASKAKSDGAVTVTLGKPTGKLPAIGVGVPMAEAKAALARADLIAAANPAHLICQIDGRHGGQSQAARVYQALKEKTGSSLTLEIVLPAKAPAHQEVNAIAAEVRQGGLKPDAIVVTQMHDLKSFQPNTPRPWGPTYEEMAKAARAAFPGGKIGGGMLSYFTELNRKPTPKGVFDFVTHTVCPIVHAADDVSVMETLQALPSIFASARKIIGTAPYHLGPSSIACRDNPYGAAVTPNPDNGRYCLTDNDPRQRGLFGAAWNLGLLAAVAEGKLSAVALGAATGPQGVIEADGALHPAYHVLANIAGARGAKHIAAASTMPSRVACLGYRDTSGDVLWLANLTSEPHDVKIAGKKGMPSRHSLSQKTFVAASQDAHFFQRKSKAKSKASTVRLEPFEVTRLVWN